MKLTIIGGGSIFTPMLLAGLASTKDELRFDTVVLLDIDPMSLERTAAFTRRVLGERGLSTNLLPTLDRQQAIEGSDFIVFTIRVGGLAARVNDEKIPLKYGIFGDETTGPGGFSNALRTIPVMVDYARDIERWAPNAWTIPFTNPEGLLTEAVSRNSSTRVIGLCTAPYGLKLGIARYLNVEPSRITLDAIGLTHLGWVRRVHVDGVDILPEILRAAKDQGWDSELYPLAWIASLRAVPGHWFYALAGFSRPHWYYHRERVYRQQIEQGKGRAELLLEVQADILRELGEGTLTLQRLAEMRGHPILDRPILSLIAAIANDKKEVHIVDVPCADAAPGFDPAAVLEMPAIVGRSGAMPLPVEDLDAEVRGLMQSLKAYEELTIRAAVECSYELALRALLVHPLVMSYDVARPLLDDILRANRPYLPASWGDRG